MRLALGLAAGLCLLVGSSPALADDPLNHVDGTEGWDDIDTSALDRGAAWRQWRRDLRAWQAGRARLQAERARMARLVARERTEEPETAATPEPEDLQARIERARAESEGIGPARRDGSGQSLDDERPWSRK